MKTILLSVLLIGFAVAQEVKIDSVAIQAKMAQVGIEINNANEQIRLWNVNKDKAIYAYNILAEMLVPKTTEMEEDNDE